MIKFILSLTMLGGLVIAYLAGGFEHIETALKERLAKENEFRIQYLCAKAGVEYLQTTRGLAVHVDLTGKPMKCDRWKAYGK